MNESSSSIKVSEEHQAVLEERAGCIGNGPDILAHAAKVKQLTQSLFIDREWLRTRSAIPFSGGSAA